MRFSLPRKQNKFIENRNKTQKIPKKILEALETREQSYKIKYAPA